MKKTIGKGSLFLILTLALSFLLVACGGNNDNSGDGEKKNIKLGCLPVSEPVISWIKEGLEPQGYNVEVVMFDANQLPATATKDGDIDGLVGNHKVWIDTFNKENGSDLTMVEPYYYYSFLAVYSTKHNKIEDIPANATIAVPGDPSNMDRSLVTLEQAGLLTLEDKTGDFYTIMDIKDNPKNIKILETEITQTARSINDVDAVIAPAYMVNEATGIAAEEYLFEDPHNIDYPIGLVVRAEDKDSEWAKKALEYLTSEDGKKKFNDHFTGRYRLY